ncbi:MAG: hypothetical protein JKX67_12165 [Colwellia sp.]|nr:hypothetical protein [Colwellia sp.]
MEINKLPKKLTTNKQYADNARSFIQSKRDELGGAKPFFKVIYGRVPKGNESITLNNQINRGNYSAEFVGLLVDRLNLDDVSLGEFYKGSKKH